MKEQLIMLAKKKGFESQFFNSQPYFKNEPWLMTNKEDMRYKLWLFEIMLWANEKMNVCEDEIHIHICDNVDCNKLESLAEYYLECLTDKK